MQMESLLRNRGSLRKAKAYYILGSALKRAVCQLLEFSDDGAALSATHATI